MPSRGVAIFSHPSYTHFSENLRKIHGHELFAVVRENQRDSNGGERKGQNKYYPPDFDYKVHKSLAGYHGQHPLRERAKKIDQGILVIRFEMPYNIWCDGCNSHIGMGVRYNAEKSKDGMYYTTPIYKFRMKCHLCPNHFEIKTDPANHDYVIISGARRKEQRWDPSENGQIVPEDRESQKKLALDSMYKLEHGVDDQSKSKSAAPRIGQLVEKKSSHKDDFLLNQLARKRFRDVKKSSLALQDKDNEIKKKYSLNIDLVKEDKDDVRMAKLLKYSTVKCFDDKQKEKRLSIETRPLFATPSSSVRTTPSSNSSTETPKTPSQKDVVLHTIRQIATSTLVKQRVEAFAGPSSLEKTSAGAISLEPDSIPDFKPVNTIDSKDIPDSSDVSIVNSSQSGDLPDSKSSEMEVEDTCGNALKSIFSNYDASSDSSLDSD